MPSTVQNHDAARRSLQRWLRQVALLGASSVRGSLFISAALFLAGVPGAMARAHGDFSSNSSDVVTQANVSARAMRVPVVPGGDIIFRELSNVRGLSQTRVLQIVQDDQGFMWFGTQYGLDRYDGHKFRVFTPDPGRVNSLSGG